MTESIHLNGESIQKTEELLELIENLRRMNAISVDHRARLVQAVMQRYPIKRPPQRPPFKPSPVRQEVEGYFL